jgi:hypothetical protein
MTDSLHRSVHRLAHTDDSASLHRSYERTDGRTDVDPWLSTRDLLTFSDARAHIRNFPSADSSTS